MPDRWWIRRHSNGWNARVYWSGQHRNYSASAMPAEIPFDRSVPHVRFYERDQQVARNTADRGAHADCDDGCRNWEEVLDGCVADD